MTAAKSMQALFFYDLQSSFLGYIWKELYLDHVYVPFLKGKLPVIVDVGANIGVTSFYFKDFADKVYAIEPAAEHREVIAKMVEFNQIKNIEIIPYAISGKSGKTTLYHSSNKTMFSLNPVVNDNREKEEIEELDMEAFMDKYKLETIDFMKLDVEGVEGQIVTSEAFKRVAPRIKTIIGEYHDWASMNKDVFKSALVDIGYNFNWLQGVDASMFSAVRK